MYTRYLSVTPKATSADTSSLKNLDDRLDLIEQINEIRKREK